MRTFNAASRVLTAFVAIATSGGCSGGSSGVAPTFPGQLPGSNSVLALGRSSVSRRAVTTASFMSRDAVDQPLVFVSDAANNVVDIYRQTGENKMVGQITGFNFPSGLAVDAARNLYVTTGSSIPIYAPPYTGAPKSTLDDTGYLPNAVAVLPSGTIGVANACNAPSCGSLTGNVVFYASNSTTPCATVADPTNFGNLFFDAFDDRGNLFITGQGSSGVWAIGEVKGGCQAKNIELLTTMNAISGTTGIQVDKLDRIAIVNGIGGVSNRAIDVYDRPRNGSLGNPIVTMPLTGSAAPSQFAIRRSAVELYIADQDGASYEYQYPMGGAPLRTISVGGLPYGLAVTPPLLP
jgi:hypothetical protein